MSREVLFQTVDRALKDTRFRSRLLNDPKGTLSGLSLTREEYSALTQLTNDSFQYITENLDRDRILTTVMACAFRETTEKTLSRYNLTDLDKLISK